MADETTSEQKTVASFEGADLQRATFHRTDLTGAQLRACDLSGVVVRGSDVAGIEIDSPWLLEGGDSLWVNGVDVVPLVDAELDRRFPGRAQRQAADPQGLRAAWAALQSTWEVTIERVEQPFHPIGQPDTSYARGGHDPSVFSQQTPTWAEVLEVRACQVARVRDFLATVTVEDLEGARTNPWAPQYAETVLSCLRTILEEEWEHHRSAVRDLDAIEAAASASAADPARS